MAGHFPERVLVAHPLNPPHLIPLLELVPGKRTSASVRTSALRFYEGLGMRVVMPRAEQVGHVANRLQAALLREAFSIAIDGTLDVPDIDAVLTHGLALRWACAGPFALTEVGGGAGGSRHMLTHLGQSLNGWWRDLSALQLDAPGVDALLETMAAHPPQACSKAEAEALARAMLGYREFCAGRLEAVIAGRETHP
jgi:3-hydroxyacyl-CoA dehydrogenase